MPSCAWVVPGDRIAPRVGWSSAYLWQPKASWLVAGACNVPNALIIPFRRVLVNAAVWGWRESNYHGVLRTRNLLILQYGRKAKNARNAEVRYTAGTPIEAGRLTALPPATCRRARHQALGLLLDHSRRRAGRHHPAVCRPGGTMLETADVLTDGRHGFARAVRERAGQLRLFGGPK